MIQPCTWHLSMLSLNWVNLSVPTEAQLRIATRESGRFGWLINSDLVNVRKEQQLKSTAAPPSCLFLEIPHSYFSHCHVEAWFLRHKLATGSWITRGEANMRVYHKALVA